MKDLQEMNLVDDFLVNSLTSHKIYGESASRYILECIFRRKIGKLKVVPQRFLCGDAVSVHEGNEGRFAKGTSGAVAVHGGFHRGECTIGRFEGAAPDGDGGKA